MGRFLFNAILEDSMTDQPETGITPEPETGPDPTSQAHTPETGESAEARIARMEAALKKANAEAAAHRKKLDAIEKAEQAKKDAELSELEQVRKRLAEAEAKATQLERTNLQRQAAEKFKLPVALADRLKGETLDELEADAEALAKTLPKTTAPTVPPTNPGGNASQGETSAQRRARRSGGGLDFFDPGSAAKHGGGLIITTKE